MPAFGLMSNSIAPGKRISRQHDTVKKVSKRRVYEMIDELGIGLNAQECYEFARDAMRGKIPNPADPNQFVYIPIKDRIECAMWLAEQKNGKSVATVDVAHEHNHRHQHDLTLLTGTDLDVVEAALMKMESLGPGETNATELHAPSNATVDAAFTPDEEPK